MCFFSTAVDFTTPLMITDALWVSYVTRNAFLNALSSFFCPSFILTKPDISPIFIFNSIIINGSFYQIFKYCLYSALPEQKVGYVSFARVFFVNSVEKVTKKMLVQLLLIILTEFYKNF